MALEREFETYEERLRELVASEGKFVLIHGENLVDIFTSYEDAIKRGYEKFRLDPFLAKRIRLTKETMVISRLVDPTTAVAAG